MRHIVFSLLTLALPLFASAKMVRDTVATYQNDRIILTYEISEDNENVLITVNNKPRIIPSDNLRKSCDGDLELLKVVIFDRVGDYGKTKWNGISPTAFMIPSGLSYDRSNEGYYILGETTTPISFSKHGNDNHVISFPLYVAVYEDKQKYKIVSSCSKPLKVAIGKASNRTGRNVHRNVETEQIAIQSSEVIEADNEDVLKALSSIQQIRRLLADENEIPFSQILQMEISNLRLLKDRVKDMEVIEKINETLLLYNKKEQELKEAQKNATIAAKAQEQALIARQKAEEDARQKEAEEKALIQEEKQQKRTLWMIIGGAILAVLAFVGNAVFRHFRDVRNQRSIMEMQESIAKQAEHEATRRAREVVRNKAHQMVNKGKSKVRATLNDTGKAKQINKDKKNNTNTKIKSI